MGEKSMEKLGKGENLSERVLERIQKSILNREYLPGELLPSEKEMAEAFGVGKSSIREAIKMLQVLGIAESAQGKGTFLREAVGPQILRPLLYDLMLQQSTAHELYEFRLMFDVAYHYLAVEKATEKDRRLAKQRFAEYKSLFEMNLPVAEADIAFHKVILEATRNPFIVKVGMLIMELCDPYFQGSDAIHDEKVMRRHEEILDIFCTGDTTNLENAIKGSMSTFQTILNKVY